MKESRVKQILFLIFWIRLRLASANTFEIWANWAVYKCFFEIRKLSEVNPPPSPLSVGSCHRSAAAELYFLLLMAARSSQPDTLVDLRKRRFIFASRLGWGAATAKCCPNTNRREVVNLRPVASLADGWEGKFHARQLLNFYGKISARRKYRFFFLIFI